LKLARRACNIYLSVVAVWGILVVLVSSAGCSPRSILAVDADLLCPHQAARWKVIVALDAFTEVAIVLLVPVLLSPHQMKWKGKLYVVIAFAARLPNVVFSIIFLSTFLSHLDRTRSPHTDRVGDTDPSVSIALPTAWFESMLAYSLVSATMPCLQNGMKKFRTGGLSFAWD
jgi:hypothetical protein